MGSDRPSVSDAELQVLKVLWQHGPGTVRQINERLPRRQRRWAYNTLLTLLSRLRDKGYVASDTSGVAHVFRPLVSQQKLLRQRLAELADQVCDGTASPLVHALVEGRQFSAADIRRFRELLDEIEEGNPSGKGRKPKR